LWGALHGGALAVNRWWQRRGPKPKPGDPGPGLLRTIWSTFVTFHFVCFCWVFFRAQTFGHAKLLLSRLAHLDFGTTNLPPKVVVLVVIAMVLHFIPRDLEAKLRTTFVRMPALVQGAVLAACAYGLHAAAGAKAEPFVYGQF
jgi:hypothetical protein